jgi:hypothetical protein
MFYIRFKKLWNDFKKNFKMKQNKKSRKIFMMEAPLGEWLQD